MKIRIVSVEDGIGNVRFRKVTAYVRSINADTHVHYVATGKVFSLRRTLFMMGTGEMKEDDVENISECLSDADIIGFSSMTPYAATVARIISAIRRRNSAAFIVWGGVHAIVEPEDAIKHADAACTGEGEFAFEMLLSALRDGRPYTSTPSFWFNSPQGVIRNRNLPLMTREEMDRLPAPTYQDGEDIYKPGKDFVPITLRDFLNSSGLSYRTIWSIGCPMKCTYCSNSKFVEYDKGYRKIRHSSPETIVSEIRRVIQKHRHISTISFDDDSFMAIKFSTLKDFCDLYSREIAIPFVVHGLVPNYVREDKLMLLITAGLNRVRMGIQSGSQDILNFYDRATPLSRIKESTIVINKFSKYMIPPAFDIILDNPLETVDDTRATLDLLYDMPKPYTLNLFSLKVIPNTGLAMAFAERGIEVADIRSSYARHVPSLSNIVIYMIVIFNLPRGFYIWLRARAIPAHAPQKHYPALMLCMRWLYLVKRVLAHLRAMDFSVINGMPDYILWKIGVIGFWRKYVLRKPPSPAISSHS